VEFLELILNLLEKVSVLVAASLVLLLLRPAEVWLGEHGKEASVRRRLFLMAVLGGLAVWGVFLGFDIGGTQFNVRAVGIIVAGYLGGRKVGLSVGALAGLVYAITLNDPTSPYVFAASVIDGGLAGLWSRKVDTGVVSVVLGAIVIQMVHHVGLGAVMAAVDLDQAIVIASNLELHAAKIAANVIGVSVFMGLLSLVRELEFARDEAQVSRDLVRSAKLEALQYQVRPHFLFNLLNTLAYLIRTNPTKARELTLDLSEFLRYTLAKQDQQTSLKAELDQIERYVDLERARFGEGLRFEVHAVDTDILDQVVVPPLILQPLVENAIRHGARDGKVALCVDVRRDGDMLAVQVLDDGPGPPGKDTISGGVGLQNVQERLERFYRGEATLRLSARADRTQTSGTQSNKSGACAEVRVPMDVATGVGPSGLREQAREKLRKVIT
jgi:LytS/YehU family sensor histidine kinase